MARARVRRTNQASRDLYEIGLFIAEKNPEAAYALLDRIDQVAEMLAENPAAGKLRPETSRNIRSYPVGSYVIFYEPADDGILLLRVLHGARDIPELL